nr:T9SS type A sorting domain-containing protein [Chryseosolibacter histidini]
MGDAVEVIDISNSSAPTHKGTLVHGTSGALLDGAQGIAVAGDYIYTVSAANHALEISNFPESTLFAASTSNRTARQFEVFPNPTVDNLTILLPSVPQIIEVQVVDAMGTLNISKKIYNNEPSVNLNVGHLRAGIYIVRIIGAANEEVVSRRIRIER